MDEDFDEVREKEIKKRKSGDSRLILNAGCICDETGGEGRNFQFASELFHYDLPLQAKK